MPLDKNGNYERWQGPDRCKNDRDADIKILASRMDDELNDMAAGLSDGLPADGRKPMSGALKMGGNQIKNIARASDAADAARAEQVQSGTFNYAADLSEEANAVVVNLLPAPTDPPRAWLLFIKVKNANTGKTTLKVNTLAAKPVLLGGQEIGEGVLKAGECYVFFYNNALDAYQLLLSGASAGTAVPPFTMILLDHLLTGSSAVGWELQGTRCYKSKYWDQYQQLVSEYAAAVARTETVEGTEFSYKLNTDTMRRFYSKNDYDARFTLCGDTGGCVLDEETYSFYLPKSNNYFRPAVDADNLAAYQTDTMRPLTGTITNYPNWGNATADGMFEIQYGSNAWGGLEDWRAQAKVVANSGKLGAHYGGAETAPKSRFVAVYYKMGSAYTEQISQSVLDAGQFAREAGQTLDEVTAQAGVVNKAVAAAQAAAQEAQDAARGLTPDGSTITKNTAGKLQAAAVMTNLGAVGKRYLTQAEYDALSAEEKLLPIEYNIFADEVAA